MVLIRVPHSEIEEQTDFDSGIGVLVIEHIDHQVLTLNLINVRPPTQFGLHSHDEMCSRLLTALEILTWTPSHNQRFDRLPSFAGRKRRKTGSVGCTGRSHEKCIIEIAERRAQSNDFECLRDRVEWIGAVKCVRSTRGGRFDRLFWDTDHKQKQGRMKWSR